MTVFRDDALVTLTVPPQDWSRANFGVQAVLTEVDSLLDADRLSAGGNYAAAVEILKKTIAELEKGASPKPALLANVLADYSYTALFTRSFEDARAAIEQALALAPERRWMEINRAHVLMFLGETAAAEKIYFDPRGHDDESWEQTIREDFAALRRAGLDHPHMAEVEARFDTERKQL